MSFRISMWISKYSAGNSYLVIEDLTSCKYERYAYKLNDLDKKISYTVKNRMSELTSRRHSDNIKPLAHVHSIPTGTVGSIVREYCVNLDNEAKDLLKTIHIWI